MDNPQPQPTGLPERDCLSLIHIYAPATAVIVAKAVGLNGALCPPGPIPESVHPEQFAIYAGVLPEDKFKLVKAFQKGGHTVGMCGDGANDGPALRQAQMGIAVSTATDVAKSAAGMVLTEPGLTGDVYKRQETEAPIRGYDQEQQGEVRYRLGAEYALSLIHI